MNFIWVQSSKRQKLGSRGEIPAKKLMNNFSTTREEGFLTAKLLGTQCRKLYGDPICCW
jgi:hypothetical protein